jgi:nitroreductase
MAVRTLVAQRSIRSFRRDLVPPETIRIVIEQARWTGSARNRQPWQFVAVYDQSARTSLSQLGRYAAHLADAPVVLVLLSPTDRQSDTDFDLGRIAQSITIVAAELGLGSCITSLYPDDNALIAASLVSAGPAWTARHAIALGYPDEHRLTGRSAIPTGRRETAELLRLV